MYHRMNLWWSLCTTGCSAGGVYVPQDAPLVEFMYHRMHLWWSLCTTGCTSGGVYVPQDAPLVEFMHIVFTRMPGGSYCRRLGSLLYLCDVFRALIDSPAC